MPEGVSPRVCLLEFQETVEVPEVESADQERQVPMITKAEFVDPETVDEQEPFARGYVSPRDCLQSAGADRSSALPGMQTGAGAASQSVEADRSSALPGFHPGAVAALQSAAADRSSALSGSETGTDAASQSVGADRSSALPGIATGAVAASLGAAAAVEAFAAVQSLVVDGSRAGVGPTDVLGSGDRSSKLVGPTSQVAAVCGCDGKDERIEEEKFFECEVELVLMCEAGCGPAEPMNEDSQVGRGFVAEVGNTGSAACCERDGADQVVEELAPGYCPEARALDPQAVQAVQAVAVEQTLAEHVESEDFVLQEAQGSDCNVDELEALAWQGVGRRRGRRKRQQEQAAGSVSDLVPVPVHGEPSLRAGKGKGLHPAAGPAASVVQPDEQDDDILQGLLDIRDSVYEVQDVPGRTKRECFAVVRSVLLARCETFDPSPEEAAVLAEIYLHIGHC